MTYNTSKILWSNFKAERANMPNGGALLNVFDGMVGCGNEVIARFESNKAAIETLESTGFEKRSSSDGQIIYK